MYPDIPQIPKKVWKKNNATVVNQRKQDLEAWLQTIVQLDEMLLWELLEFLQIDTSSQPGTENKVNESEKLICQLLFRLHLNEKQISRELDYFQNEFFRIKQKIKPNYCASLVSELVPLWNHEFSGAKSVHILATLWNRSKSFNSTIFVESFLGLDITLWGQMTLNKHLCRKVRGDSYTQAKRLLKILYEHYCTKSQAFKIHEVLNFDGDAIDLFNQIVDPKSEQKNSNSPPEEPLSATFIEDCFDVWSLEDLVLRRRVIDETGFKHELSLKFEIQMQELNHATDVYVFGREIWNPGWYTCIECIANDSFIMHVQQTTAYAVAVDFCIKTTVTCTSTDATIQIESCEHPLVPERLGVIREVLFPTTVHFTQQEDNVVVEVVQQLNRHQIKKVLSDFNFSMEFLQLISNYRNQVRGQPGKLQRIKSYRESILAVPEKRIVSYD